MSTTVTASSLALDLRGARAYVYTGGVAFDAAKPSVLLIHGAQNDHSVWLLQSRYLAHHGLNALAVDLPGHGKSGGAPCPTVEAYADWLLALIDALGVTRCALVGHSMGSLIALACAALRPQAVTHLALVGTAYPMQVSQPLLDAARERPDEAMRMVNRYSISTVAAKPAQPGPGAWLHGGSLRLMQRLQAQAAAHSPGTNLFANDFAACNAYAGGLDAAARVACPVLFVLGRADQMTQPRAAKPLQQALPQARTVLVDAGHALMAEAPDAVLDALREFLL
jgi:pimeloyl-ACP methyl ester carboxylesterase